MAKDFTHTDYYSASINRQADLLHLAKNPDSVIFSVYCAGVSIECMFRAYITKYTKEFDSKHDLEKLYEKSQLSNLLDEKEKENLTIAVKSANRLWSNDLRYVSEVRMKRKISHYLIKKGLKGKDIIKLIGIFHSDIFSATDLIIKTGQEKWT
jgi:hypothetical protein